MSREQELIWAMEVQIECMADLKKQLAEKQNLIDLQATLLRIRDIQLNSQKKDLHEYQMKLNYEWN
jgi:hypothetical protein